MKIDMLKRVRERIAEVPREHFNMDVFGMWLTDDDEHPCGTVMCIAGHAASLDPEVTMTNDDNGRRMITFTKNGQEYNPCKLGEEFLDLTCEESDHMFYGRWSPKNLTKITREETVAYLDRVIETGSVFDE